ncbi:MAG TPA: isochorismatase family cysteine hydrolase [Candidatus Binatia bacterium]|nr:isochorismatase family cysteine hydrolase [Candidatus Binatia bacterium]
MALSLEERVDAKHGMLIVVDMQNDFCHRDGAACKRGRDMGFVQDMIPRLIRLVAVAREQRFPICFVRTSGNQWTNSPVWTEFKNPDLLACAEGSWGAEFHPGLEPRSDEMVVTKHRYSAFIGTDLDMLLRARGVKSLLVTGVGTGMCVFHTLTVGFMLDYYITLVEDCAATTYGRESHNEAVALVRKHYGRIASSKEIVGIWQKNYGSGKSKVA